MNKVTIPKHVDDPPQILIFSIDEFVIMVGFAVVGSTWGLLLPGLFVGFAIGKLFRKMQEGAMPGLLFHMLWWVGLVTLKGRLPNGLIREIYE